jgi:3-oxoadipate enol-lactonase
MQFARIGEVTIHYQMIGDPTVKPLIVFANSLGTDFRIWRDVVVRLAGDFAILTYDKRGHGLSDVGPTPYSIEDHAGDLAGLLDLIGAPAALVCGVSVGGIIAQALYAARPDLVRGLILCDTAHKVGTAEVWNARIEAVEQRGIAEIAGAILERWFTANFRKPGNAEYVGYRNMLVRQPAAGYAATCAALRDADLSQLAPTIAVPTLCVVGDQDGSTPPSLVAEFARMIPGARFEVIKNCGHLPSIEQPAMLAGMIQAFAALAGAAAGPQTRH